MKKLIALFLAGLFALSLTACSQKISEEEYTTSMGELVDSYGLVIDTLDTSLEYYTNTEEWWQAIDALKTGSDDTISALEKDVTPYVPDSCMQKHQDLVAAMTAYSDAMAKIQEAQGAASEEEIQAGIDEGKALGEQAAAQWEAAVAALQ